MDYFQKNNHCIKSAPFETLVFPAKGKDTNNKYTLSYEHTIYTSTTNQNGQLRTLLSFFSYRYIPLQKYTEQSLRMR